MGYKTWHSINSGNDNLKIRQTIKLNKTHYYFNNKISDYLKTRKYFVTYQRLQIFLTNHLNVLYLYTLLIRNRSINIYLNHYHMNNIAAIAVKAY